MAEGAMVQIPNDHPLKKAWDAYQETEDYQTSYKWATAGIDPPLNPTAPGANAYTRHNYHQFVEGSLWAAFMAGFAAAGGKTSL